MKLDFDKFICLDCGYLVCGSADCVLLLTHLGLVILIFENDLVEWLNKLKSMMHETETGIWYEMEMGNDIFKYRKWLGTVIKKA